MLCYAQDSGKDVRCKYIRSVHDMQVHRKTMKRQHINAKICSLLKALYAVFSLCSTALYKPELDYIMFQSIIHL